MNQMRKFRRSLSFLLAFVLLVTAVPASVLWAEDFSAVRVLHNGEVTDSVLLHQDKRLTLTAESDLSGDLHYSWEVLARPESNRWVPISGRITPSCEISYALIANVMNASGEAVIRCTVGRDSERYYSDPITVKVAYGVPMFANKKNDPPISDANDGISALADEAKDIYTVTIYYQFEGEVQANPPAVLTYAAGARVERYVDSPLIVGYEPVYYTLDAEGNVVEQPAESLLLFFEAINEDKTMYVVYKPTLVKYSVHHHRQNLLDDGYESEPFQITEKIGYTGTEVSDCVLELEGYHGMIHAKADEPTHIAADGSTVVEVYYERHYYLVDFDLNGGYGTNSLYTRYGSEVSADDPTYPGHKFIQWILVGCRSMEQIELRAPTEEEKLHYAIVSPETVIVVDQNLYYEAIWALDYTSYTVVYWKENANDENYSFWGSKTVGLTDDGVYDQSVSAGLVVSGQDDFVADDKEHFTFDFYKTDKNVVVKNDGSTIVNVYYTRNTYQVKFQAYSPEQDCILEEHTHGDGCTYENTCGYQEHTHTAECIPICGKEEHTHSSACCTVAICTSHSASCYPEGVVGAIYNGRPSNAPTNPTEGQIYRYLSYSWLDFGYKAYIYVGGSWYTYGKAANSVSNGDIISRICHYQHGTKLCSCSKEEHEHSDLNSCYRDIEHIHGEGCQVCTKIEHTHGSGGNKVVYMITAKYEEDIGAEWPTYETLTALGAHQNANRQKFLGWTGLSSNSTYTSKRLHMTPELFGKTATASYGSGSEGIYYYLFEDVDQTDQTEIPLNETGEGRIQNNGIWYVSNPDYYQVLYSNGTLSAKDILGMTSQNSSPRTVVGTNDRSCLCFFYNRNAGSDMVLSFYNVDRVDKSFTVSNGLKYGMPLSLIAAINSYVADENEPGYPVNLEPGGYQFVGWFTTPECFSGTEVQWETVEMPDGALTLYAKWEPVYHTVDVYLDSTMTQKAYETQIVAHGHHATGENSADSSPGSDYIFVGWFYVDEDGREQYFKFNSMPVKRSLQIYAKWRSTKMVNYTVHFQLADGRPVAESISETTLAGYNRTIRAATDTDLFPEYREGYFPRVSSHSIMMKEEGENTFTFIYDYHEKLEYTVSYKDENGGDLVAPISAKGYFVEVTEIFKYVEGYTPDAYSKTLILSSSDPAQNVITFSYTKDEAGEAQKTYYRVSSYLQKADDLSSYEAGSQSAEILAEVGSQVTVSPFAYDGVELAYALIKGSSQKLLPDANGRIAAGALPASGMEIQLYYNRVKSSYKVQYLEINTNKVLYPSVSAEGVFGQTVTVSYADLSDVGYSLVGNLPSREITLKKNAEDNVVTFYYQELQANFQYYAVWGSNGKTLRKSETVGASTGTAEGYEPFNTEDYTFVGWYLDERGSFPVTPNEKVALEGTKLLPQKAQKTFNGQSYSVYSGATYYALYMPNYSKLTVDVVDTEGIHNDQAFLYRIQGIDAADGMSQGNQHIDMIVAVHKTSVITISEIPVGNYVVTDMTDWSWRYVPNDGEYDSQVNSVYQKQVYVSVDDTRVNFNYICIEDQWLSDETHEHILCP